MTSEIIGVFESVDTAEFALTRLRELGIPLISYRIRSFYRGEGKDDPHALPGSYLPINATNDTPLMGNLYMAAPVFTDASGERDHVWREEPSEEVALHILLEEYNAGRAKSALVSSHGRQITERQRLGGM